MPLLIDAEVLFVDDQLNVTAWPAKIDVGDACSDAVGRAGVELAEVRITTNTPNSTPVWRGVTELPIGNATVLNVMGTLALEPSNTPVVTGGP